MSEAPAADYALTVIEALSKSTSFMGISDISRETGINKNAVSRVLGALNEAGWVYQDGVRYQLTLKPFRIVSGALARTSFLGAAQPSLTRLWEETGDSCYIGILQNDAVLYLSHLDSTHDLRISGRVGGCYPLSTSAPGKVLLSYADSDYRRHYFSEILKADKKTAEEFELKAAMVRELGYATDIEEYGPGIICFAAPVFDIDGKVVGTIGISTSTVYCSPDELFESRGLSVLRAAEEISEIMGFTKENAKGNIK